MHFNNAVLTSVEKMRTILKHRHNLTYVGPKALGGSKSTINMSNANAEPQQASKAAGYQFPRYNQVNNRSDGS